MTSLVVICSGLTPPDPPSETQTAKQLEAGQTTTEPHKSSVPATTTSRAQKFLV